MITNIQRYCFLKYNQITNKIFLDPTVAFMENAVHPVEIDFPLDGKASSAFSAHCAAADGQTAPVAHTIVLHLWTKTTDRTTQRRYVTPARSPATHGATGSRA